jgi:hypothetical protein
MPRGRKIHEIDWEYINYPAPVPRYTRVVGPKLFDAMWNKQLWTHLQTQTAKSAAENYSYHWNYDQAVLRLAPIGVKDMKDSYNATGVVFHYPGKERILQREQ